MANLLVIESSCGRKFVSQNEDNVKESVELAADTMGYNPEELESVVLDDGLQTWKTPDGIYFSYCVEDENFFEV